MSSIDNAAASLRRAPDNRIISHFPLPYSINSTPYPQTQFSPSTLDSAASIKSALALKLAKMVVLGDCGVGKTALVNRFCHNVFNANYKATIGVDFEVERFDILDVAFNLQIWDTAGQERFKCIAKSYYRDANVICLVFDLTDQNTLSNTRKWLDDAMEVNMSAYSRYPPLIFLIGTKADLLMTEALEGARLQAAALAHTMKAELWLVSSKSGTLVHDLFFRISALAFDTLLLKQHGDKLSKHEIGHGLVNVVLKEDLFEEKRRQFCTNSPCK